MALKVLALETATDACSAALIYQDTLLERFQIAPRQHTTLILPMLEELLAEAGLTLGQLDAIAFGCGPGSFTGVRVATAVAQGIAFAQDLPVVPISTLRALAQGCFQEYGANRVLAALDAHMSEVYWGVYGWDNSQGTMVAAEPERVCSPSAITVPADGVWCGYGSGWDSYHEVLQAQLGARLQQWIPCRYPKASEIARLAVVDYQNNLAVSAEHALPVYLRDNVAKKKGEVHG